MNADTRGYSWESAFSCFVSDVATTAFRNGLAKCEAIKRGVSWKSVVHFFTLAFLWNSCASRGPPARMLGVRSFPSRTIGRVRVGDRMASFNHLDALIRRRIIQHVDAATEPVNFHAINMVVLAQSKLQA